MVFFLTRRHLLLALHLSHPHLIGQQTVIGIIGNLHFHLAPLLLSTLLPPVDPKLSDSGLIGKNSPSSMGDQSGSIGIGPFLLREGVIDNVMDIVSHSDELLVAVADGDDDGSDA